jgi:hypothetical protein
METESRSKSETEGKLRKQYFLEIKQERKWRWTRKET